MLITFIPNEICAVCGVETQPHISAMPARNIVVRSPLCGECALTPEGDRVVERAMQRALDAAGPAAPRDGFEGADVWTSEHL